MIVKRAFKIIGISLSLAMLASLGLGCASKDADKGAQYKDPQTKLPVASTDTGEGKGLYPENRGKGEMKELEKEQEKKQLFQIAASVRALSLLAVTMVGCGGGGADVKSQIRATSKGQELIDLKKALDAGAITQKEYDWERQKIIDRDQVRIQACIGPGS